MVLCEGINKVSRIHPLGPMNVSTKCQMAIHFIVVAWPKVSERPTLLSQEPLR